MTSHIINCCQPELVEGDRIERKTLSSSAAFDKLRLTVFGS